MPQCMPFRSSSLLTAALIIDVLLAMFSWFRLYSWPSFSLVLPNPQVLRRNDQFQILIHFTLLSIIHLKEGDFRRRNGRSSQEKQQRMPWKGWFLLQISTDGLLLTLIESLWPLPRFLLNNQEDGFLGLKRVNIFGTYSSSSGYPNLDVKGWPTELT